MKNEAPFPSSNFESKTCFSRFESLFKISKLVTPEEETLEVRFTFDTVA